MRASAICTPLLEMGLSFANLHPAWVTPSGPRRGSGEVSGDPGQRRVVETLRSDRAAPGNGTKNPDLRAVLENGRKKESKIHFFPLEEHSVQTRFLCFSTFI